MAVWQRSSNKHQGLKGMGCFHKGYKPGADVPSTGSALMDRVPTGAEQGRCADGKVTVNHPHVTKDGDVKSQV